MKLTLETPRAKQIAEAPISDFRVRRVRDAQGQFTGEVEVTAEILLGEPVEVQTLDDAGNPVTVQRFAAHETIVHTEVVEAGAVGAFAGPELRALQRKLLQRMQAAGKLPAGTIG